MLTAVSEGHNSMGYAKPSPFIQWWLVYNSRKDICEGRGNQRLYTNNILIID